MVLKRRTLNLFIMLLLTAALLQRGAIAGEMRGAWIHSATGVPGWGWDRTVKALADNGYNALFANLMWAASAEYPSKVLTPHPSLAKKGSSGDNLRECLDACRKYGVQLHVWIVVCNMGHRTPEKVRQEFRDAGRVQLNDAGEASDYLAPHLPENVTLLKDAVRELLTEYRVDGVHLDYIRYPAGKYDFSASARAAFEKSTGSKVEKWPGECLKDGKRRQEFLQWRRDNITNLVRAVREVIRETRPEVALSAAVYGYWPGAREGVGQDAALWAKEKLVDFLCPMNYSGESWEAGAWLRQQLNSVDGAVPVYTGLANYMCANPEVLKEQIQEAREYGADGFITFQCTEKFAVDWLPELRKDVVKDDSAAPFAHEMPRPAGEWLLPDCVNERYLRRISVGDTLAMKVTWPDKMELAAESLRISIVRNGSVEKHNLQDSHLLTVLQKEPRTMTLALSPAHAGYYRILLEWRDAGGREMKWYSSPRVVHAF